MRIVEGEGLVTVKALEDSGDLDALTRLIALSSEIADRGRKLCDTERATVGMELMEISDRIADAVGVLAHNSGHTADHVIAPLWKDTTVDTPQAA